MPLQTTTPEGDAIRQAQTDAGINPIDSLTLAQALTYLQNNVIDLASAKVYLGLLTKLVFIQKRRIDRLWRDSLAKAIGNVGAPGAES